MARTNDWLLREPGAEDFGDAYLSTLDELNAALEPQLASHPLFGPMIAGLSIAQRELSAAESRKRFALAFRGDWQQYADGLKRDGQTYAAMGIRFDDWYDVATLWSRAFLPLLVRRFGHDLPRLSNALQAMQTFLDAAMAVLGRAYIDASEARVREQQLHAARWAAVFENVAWAIAITDGDGVIELANNAFSKLYGVSKSDVEGRDIDFIYAPGELERMRREHAQHARTVGQLSAESIHRKSDGTELHVQVEAAHVPGLSGKLGWVVSIQDLGERREMEALRRRGNELEAENRRIAEASRTKSEFLANMSHELRTPLNSILGFSDLLERGEVGDLSAEQREFVSDIHASGRHLLGLINDVLDLAKVESGKMEFHPEPIRIREVLREVMSVLKGVTRARGVRITESVADDVESIHIDPARLKQVLYNYLSNAIKFTREGSTVTVAVRREGPAAFRLEVRDQGPGITPENLDRLFLEFEQLDGGRAKTHAGTGLGLALTKRLVEAQGGTVGVQSVLGDGCVFHAILPLRARGTSSLPRPRELAGASPNAPRILVVEDDQADQDRLVATLSSAGFAVDTAATGAQALEALRQHAYDAITLDLLLPDASGLQILGALRRNAHASNTPVIVVSVVTENVTGGFVVHDVLDKPLDESALLTSLARAGVAAPSAAPVLVVDDDERSARLAAATLAKSGFRTVIASNGAAALEMAAAEQPSAVVLDLVMPVLDGFGFLERFRAEPRWAHIPVLVWTVKDLSSTEENELAMRAEAVLPKDGSGARMLVEQLRVQLGTAIVRSALAVVA